MLTLLAVLCVLFAIAAALYWCAPRVLFDLATALARRSAGLRRREVFVDGHRLPYLEGGQGEALVLLHGFGANKDHWTAVAAHLTRHFHVFAPDLPGFGESSRDPAARYGVDQQLARIAAFLDRLGIERCHLGGNSMGGYLATLFAVRHPERVASLWLLAPAGTLTSEPSETLRALEAGDNPLIVSDAAAFARLGALCFCRPPSLPAQFVRVLERQAIAESGFNQRIFEHMFAEPRGLEEAAAGLAVRTLAVWGDDDRVLHPSGLAVLGRLLGDVECILMPRMGHVPMVERPAEAAADLLRFHGRLVRA